MLSSEIRRLEAAKNAAWEKLLAAEAEFKAAAEAYHKTVREALDARPTTGEEP